MAQRGIREYDGKRMLFTALSERFPSFEDRARKLALVTPETKESELLAEHPWLKKEKLVVKPDQLFGKRGKHGLVCLNADWKAAWAWIRARMQKSATVGKTEGTLTHFLIEPFTPHADDEEYYVAFKAEKEHDVVYFSTKGGIYVEEHWDKVLETRVPVLEEPGSFTMKLPVAAKRQEATLELLRGLHRLFAEGHFTYLEINPFTFAGDEPVPLDLVAKVDDTGAFECRKLWAGLEFPAAFGSSSRPEEAFIKSLDEKSGSSLKLTILNPEGRVWLMVAGGGASVIYTDTVCDLGASKALANYGEYSGNPTTDETCHYARTILDLMTRKKDAKGKVLLIGGGIANFTDVAKTFTGIIKALEEYKAKLVEHKVRIYVRRGGPNYKEGLERMRRLGTTLGVPIEVYGPETHMTKIVSMALKG
ncbi:MAG: ATP citrate lyase citrate-binding domain-containing protein [Elusimicrobiota bacterium]|jgi:ATP-citrate lyase beta-subunit